MRKRDWLIVWLLLFTLGGTNWWLGYRANKPKNCVVVYFDKAGHVIRAENFSPFTITNLSLGVLKQ